MNYLLYGIERFLIEKEMVKLDEIINENTHPFIVVMGGKKMKKLLSLLVAGAMFTVWIGERITEHGVSNGISILIFIWNC